MPRFAPVINVVFIPSLLMGIVAVLPYCLSNTVEYQMIRSG